MKVFAISGWNTRAFRYILATVLLAIVGATNALAAEPQTPPARAGAEEQQALAQREQALKAQQAEQKEKLAALKQRRVSPELLDEARLAADSARVQLEAAQLDSIAAERQLRQLEGEASQLGDELNQLIAGTLQAPAGVSREQAITQKRAALEQKKTQVDVQQTRLSNLQYAQELARQELDLAQRWWQAVHRRAQQQEQQARQEVLADLETWIEGQQQQLSDQAAALRKQLAELGEDEPGRRHLLETRIKGLEESQYLLDMRLEIERARNVLAGVEEQLAPGGRLPQETLRTMSDELASQVTTLESVEALATRKLGLLRQQLRVLDRRESLQEASAEQVKEERALITNLNSRFEQRLASLRPVLALAKDRLETVRKLYRQSVQRGLGVRHSLFTQPSPWPEIWAELIALPQTIFSALTEAAGSMIRALIHSSARTAATLVAFIAIWGWVCFRSVSAAEPPAEQRTFSARARRVIILLFRQNRLGLFFAVATVGSAFILALPAEDVTLFATFFGAWLAARGAHWILRFLLVGEHLPPTERQYRLYRLAVWVTWIGFAFAVVLILGHLGLYPTVLRDFLDRVFMGFLLLPAYLGFRVRGSVVSSVETTLVKRHWLRAVRLIAFLIPLSILVAALLGLIGYLNLAWAVARHLAWFLVIFSSWLIVQGLLRDAAALVKDYVNDRTARGLDWAQGVVDPVHQILRLALFIGALVVLVAIYGWGPDSVFGQAFGTLIDQPLARIGNLTIDVRHVLVTVLIVVFAVWLGRQVRELTYRWLYSGIIDIGVRHSLAVFTQYAVVLVGFLVALDAFGLDLTSLAIFAGALGVGIGFGLQAIANNFISGIVLLAERPLRSGDWVTIGTDEGEVTRIGMRSLTVTTWDNQEVIIPNADVVSGAFTNWTHQDNLVRTVIKLRVSYHEDPERVTGLVLDVLNGETAVLQEPPPRVWLHEFGEFSFEFWVHYFTDVRKHIRLEIRSVVLKALWERLCQEGVRVPYPRQEVHLQPGEEGGQSLGLVGPRE